MRNPSDAVFIEKSIQNVHSTIQHQFVPQPCSGIDPCDADTTACAIVDHSGLYPSQLVGIGEFMLPVCFVSEVHFGLEGLILNL
jgi:hypothetical protein